MAAAAILDFGFTVVSSNKSFSIVPRNIHAKGEPCPVKNRKINKKNQMSVTFTDNGGRPLNAGLISVILKKCAMTSDTWRNLRIVFNAPSRPYWQYF